MSNLCNFCGKSTWASGLRCSGFCGCSHHANGKCTDISGDQLPLIKSLPGGGWFCRGCRTDNNIPLSGSTNAKNKQSRQSIVQPVVSSQIGNDDVINVSRAEIALLPTEISELKRSVNFCSDKISDFSHTEELKKENHLLNEKLSAMPTKLNNLEQYSRSI
ncbi:hypothetical protein HHI36_018453 [Cryptolaemus montrouzieri]|uniref:Uncharacterized protein n=1 Tax=Cryptolaemus montrouzieri TaxID=559131 RepID=A0ABD2P0G5_9CUCU